LAFSVGFVRNNAARIIPVELNLTRIIIFITQPKEESMSQVYRDLLKRQKLQASIGASARSSPGQPATN
jgi:hypothetical protein